VRKAPRLDLENVSCHCHVTACFTKTKNMAQPLFRLKTSSLATGGILWPAPNVNETIEWREAKDKDQVCPFEHPDEMAGHTLRVLWNYRGALFQGEGGATVFRCAPTTEWVYTSTGFPPPGATENVRMMVGGREYMAQIEFLT